MCLKRHQFRSNAVSQSHHRAKLYSFYAIFFATIQPTQEYAIWRQLSCKCVANTLTDNLADDYKEYFRVKKCKKNNIPSLHAMNVQLLLCVSN